MSASVEENGSLHGTGTLCTVSGAKNGKDPRPQIIVLEWLTVD